MASSPSRLVGEFCARQLGSTDQWAHTPSFQPQVKVSHDVSHFICCCSAVWQHVDAGLCVSSVGMLLQVELCLIARCIDCTGK